MERMENMDNREKEIRLNLEWEYESSTLMNDIRGIDKDNYASLRFIFETYNHDGWVLFG